METSPKSRRDFEVSKPISIRETGVRAIISDGVIKTWHPEIGIKIGQKFEFVSQRSKRILEMQVIDIDYHPEEFLGRTVTASLRRVHASAQKK